MTVAELIIKLLDCPMDSDIKIKTYTDKDNEYSANWANEVVDTGDKVVISVD